MPVDLDVSFGDGIGRGQPLTLAQVDEHLEGSSTRSQGEIENAFGQAGWYSSDAPPYEPPRSPIDGPAQRRPPVVEAERRLWISRYNPMAPGFQSSDINDDRAFPWKAPEMAPVDGWWLCTITRPKNATAVAELATGDLVVCQRTDPQPDERDAGDPVSGHEILNGDGQVTAR